MNVDHKPSFLRRWRTKLVVIASVCLCLVVYALLPYFGIYRGITETNGRRIVAGMTRPEVEAVLGRPNPLPDLARERKFFWDENAVLGFRYVAILVTYDADERVANSRVNGFWRRPLWMP